MIEYIVIVFLLLYISYSEFNNRKERDELTKKLMSRNLTEYVRATPSEPEPEEKEELEEFVPLADLPDDKFQSIIKQEIQHRQSLNEKVSEDE